MQFSWIYQAVVTQTECFTIAQGRKVSSFIPVKPNSFLFLFSQSKGHIHTLKRAIKIDFLHSHISSIVHCEKTKQVVTWVAPVKIIEFLISKMVKK